MKFAVALGLLCLVAVAVSAGKSQKKREYQSEGHEEYGVEEDISQHDVKKYGNHKHHHHHQDYKRHHQKHYLTPDKASHKNSGKHLEKEKHQKQVPKSAPYDTPAHEAELQADVKTNKKHLKEQRAKHHEDLHLQDLTFEEKFKAETTHGGKSPHQYQRGHHKNSQHFVQNDAAPEQDKEAQVEEKLFEERTPKGNGVKAAPPVLEDSFEPLKDHTDPKKHSKKASKHKKANQKVKKEKKPKKEKKEKKQKKEKQWY